MKQQETIAALRERVEELERMLAERNLVVSHLLTKIEEFENLRDVRTFRNISRFVRSDDKNTCGWTPGENSFHWEYWNTECGHAFKFEGGGLEDNEFLYCSYCGKAIKVRKE